MKLFVAALMLSLAPMTMANGDLTTFSQSSEVETVIGFDKGKKRRHKRVNRKRKRRCKRAAHRNFAG